MAACANASASRARAFTACGLSFSGQQNRPSLRSRRSDWTASKIYDFKVTGRAGSPIWLAAQAMRPRPGVIVLASGPVHFLERAARAGREGPAFVGRGAAIQAERFRAIEGSPSMAKARNFAYLSPIFRCRLRTPRSCARLEPPRGCRTGSMATRVPGEGPSSTTNIAPQRGGGRPALLLRPGRLEGTLWYASKSEMSDRVYDINGRLGLAPDLGPRCAVAAQRATPTPPWIEFFELVSLRSSGPTQFCAKTPRPSRAQCNPPRGREFRSGYLDFRAQGRKESGTTNDLLGDDSPPPARRPRSCPRALSAYYRQVQCATRRRRRLSRPPTYCRPAPRPRR